jgi:hypothetical protein
VTARRSARRCVCGVLLGRPRTRPGGPYVDRWERRLWVAAQGIPFAVAERFEEHVATARRSGGPLYDELSGCGHAALEPAFGGSNELLDRMFARSLAERRPSGKAPAAKIEPSDVETARRGER